MSSIVALPDLVLLRFDDGAELELTPANARVWAESLAKFADTADVLGSALAKPAVQLRLIHGGAS